jgi:hypothetical protein
MKLRYLLKWLLLACCIPCAYAANLGFVTVSPNGPDDGSDYGPYTPGTQTSGLQEAINAAIAANKDVYYIGGTISSIVSVSSGYEFVQDTVYNLSQTLYFPPAKNFRFTGGNAVFNYTQSSINPLVRVDSQSGSELRFPLIVGTAAQATSALLLVDPQSQLADGTIQFAASRISCQALVGGGNVFGAAQGKGHGLVLQANAGQIVGNEFYVTEIVACETGIHVSGSNRLEHNTFQCVFNHLSNYGGKIFAGQNNEYRQYTEATPATPSVGFLVEGGSCNTYELMTAAGGHQQGADLQLNPLATGNTLWPLCLPNGVTRAVIGQNWLVRLEPM